ncbi:protein FAM50A [Oncorhynchus mykiss]|uniref:protein FAM50A n=1 Tax=Oncorhynchus mykiss TaxID=8022 RepID=UPI001877E216|nr:protein FAM50A [Oncorhynchus mykiss]XP_021422777.2 protein FAM50A [Oncorhynchus mykiss]
MVKSNVNKSSKLNYDAVEAELKSSTVGLVTLNDMKARQEALVKEREKQLAKKEQTKELMLKSSVESCCQYLVSALLSTTRKLEKKRKDASLSFNPEEEETEEEEDCEWCQ